MPTAAESLEEIRDAIEQLRAAASHDNDVSRGQVADWLERQIDGIHDADELNAIAADAMRLFRGGMGSFQDTGTAGMDAAVKRLRHVLHQAT